jgi:NAD(P)-dependent dehydrogenase (short-subunit alcohol dehydrogenase family)
MLLKNKYAVISGATTEHGIGYATARRFVTGATIDVNGAMYIRA